MTNHYLAGIAAQAAYADFGPNIATDLASLIEESKADFVETLASRFLGLTPNATPFGAGGFLRIAHQPEQTSGSSATIFQQISTGKQILSIRGTADAADLIQDAKLGLIGFASDQAISLYRYYKQLTTPSGQAVQYSAAEREL